MRMKNNIKTLMEEIDDLAIKTMYDFIVYALYLAYCTKIERSLNAILRRGDDNNEK